MQFVKGKPSETQYATRPGARAKIREVALGTLGLQITVTKRPISALIKSALILVITL
jgi:hypothetical protein